MEWIKKLQHPNFNVVCGIVTILSAVAAVYFWYDGIKKPELTYYISSTRTPIVQKGILTDLAVSLKGMPIENDLSLAEIQIWNRGKQAIHQSDILEKITICITNLGAFYPLTIAVTRNAIDASLRNTNLYSGIFELQFKILESHDGIRLQIAHAGNVKTPIKINGLIEGQPEGIKEYRPVRRTSSDFIAPTTFMVIAPITFMEALQAFRKNRRQLPKTRRTFRDISLMLVAGAVSLMALATFIYLVRTFPSPPPFGF